MSIVDPRCNGGDRCTAEATCVLDSTSGPDPRTGRWRYEFLCDGDWLDIDADETMPRDVWSETNIGMAGLLGMTFEEFPCDPADVTWISETCAWPRGLVGRGPGGAEIRVVNDIAVVGDWLVSSQGWESCGDFPGAYRRDLRASLVPTCIPVGWPVTRADVLPLAPAFVEAKAAMLRGR